MAGSSGRIFISEIEKDAIRSTAIKHNREILLKLISVTDSESLVTHCESFVTHFKPFVTHYESFFSFYLLYMRKKIPFLSFYLLYPHENEFSLV
jgi:hypothetical protein